MNQYKRRLSCLRFGSCFTRMPSAYSLYVSSSRPPAGPRNLTFVILSVAKDLANAFTHPRIHSFTLHASRDTINDPWIYPIMLRASNKMNCRIESECFFAPARRMGQNRRRCSQSYIEDGFASIQHSRAENKPLECRDSLLDALFLQNEPNFTKNRANASSCKTKDYKNAPSFLAWYSQSQFSPKLGSCKSW